MPPGVIEGLAWAGVGRMAPLWLGTWRRAGGSVEPFAEDVPLRLVASLMGEFGGHVVLGSDKKGLSTEAWNSRRAEGIGRVTRAAQKGLAPSDRDAGCLCRGLGWPLWLQGWGRPGLATGVAGPGEAWHSSTG